MFPKFSLFHEYLDIAAEQNVRPSSAYDELVNKKGKAKRMNTDINTLHRLVCSFSDDFRSYVEALSKQKGWPMEMIPDDLQGYWNNQKYLLLNFENIEGV